MSDAPIEFGEPESAAVEAVTTPAEHPSSPLAGLREKRARARATMFLDLAVPGYRDELGIDLYVRYHPVPSGVQQRLSASTDQNKNPERFALANAGALAAACEGIYYLDDDGVEHAFIVGDPDAAWPKFDADVAATIGVSFVDGRRLVRDLYFTDDQIAKAVIEVNRWAQGEIREREKDDRGN